jgi:ABC-2 type transport system ATP-binding protein
MVALRFDGVAIDAPDKRRLLTISEISMPSGMVALTGANGAGKSTLLRAIVGIHPIELGTIALNGIDSRKQRKLFLANSVFQPQNFAAFPELTALEFLSYFCRLRGLGRANAKQTASQWLNNVGLGYAEGQRTGTFSQGMLQRLGIAYALQTNAALMVLDEPFSAVDPEARVQLIELFSQLAQTRIILFSTHNVDEAIAHGARLAEISNSTLVF